MADEITHYFNRDLPSVILDHAFDVEALKPNVTVVCGQSVAQFIEEVFSLVGNLFMQPGNLQPHFSTVYTSLFLFGKFALKFDKFFFSDFLKQAG